MSVWEALGISDERLGKVPIAVSVAKVDEKSSGGKEIEDATVQSEAAARRRFAAFFESVLGLAIGDWPRVIERCEKGGEPLKVSDKKNTKSTKGKGKGKGKAKQEGKEDEGDDVDTMEEAMEEGKEGGSIEETLHQGGRVEVEGDEQRPAKSARMAEVEGAGRGGKKGVKKREPRRPGWEGLSFHERIAYVTFMVNVFQVSSFCLTRDK